jgi:hypothetical protein
MVHENYKHELETILHNANIEFRVVIENVSNKMKQQHDFESPVKIVENLKDFDYGKYHQLDEINAWIDALAQEYSKYITVFNVTRSFEGRPLIALKISTPSATPKKAFWFDGGIHAREWISPATVIYIAYSVTLINTKIFGYKIFELFLIAGL